MCPCTAQTGGVSHGTPRFMVFMASPLSSRPRLAPLRFASLRFAAFGQLLSPRLRSLRPAPRLFRLGFVCSVSVARLLASSRSRLETLQVQHWVGLNLLGLGGGGFKSNYSLILYAHMFKNKMSQIAKVLDRTNRRTDRPFSTRNANPKKQFQFRKF